MADSYDDVLNHLQSLKKPDYGILGDLVGAYGAYTNGNNVANAYGAQAGDAESISNAMKQQMDNMPTLDAMYGQNSPYALQLKDTLAAKDATSGRNSQYGPRSVQLQAALADKGSQYAAQQAQIANMYQQARMAVAATRTGAINKQQQTNGQQLGSLFQLGQSSGALPWLNSQISNGLSNMWSPSQTGPQYSDSPIDNVPQAGGPMNYMDTSYQSNGGMGQMYGAPDSSYAPGMDTSQAPTSSFNDYWMYDQ